MTTKTQTPEKGTPMQTPDYEPLLRVLSSAYEQAKFGKGAARHANGRDFDRQPILEYGRILGPAGTAFQAHKKIGEAIGTHLDRNGDHAAALRELHGAIVYVAATALLVGELAGGVEYPEHMLHEAQYVGVPPVPPLMPPLSPVKSGGPTVRILERDYKELVDEAGAALDKNNALSHELEQASIDNANLRAHNEELTTALRQVIARCSQVGNTNSLARNIIETLAKRELDGEGAPLHDVVNALRQQHIEDPQGRRLPTSVAGDMNAAETNTAPGGVTPVDNNGKHF